MRYMLTLFVGIFLLQGLVVGTRWKKCVVLTSVFVSWVGGRCFVVGWCFWMGLAGRVWKCYLCVSFFGGGCYIYVYIGIGLTIYLLFGDVLSNLPTSFCLGVSVFYFGDSD